MARRSSGQVVERRTARGPVYALRFYAAGRRRYETLGSAEEGWNRRRAEDELAATMAAVRAGNWQPRQQEQAEVLEVPTFHEFASDWLANREPELRPKTVTSYRWMLTHHLLPAFAAKPLDAIRPEDVDRYKSAKLREGRLAPNQVNKTLGLLARILEAGRRYGYLDRNPLEDVDRLRRTKPHQPTMDPGQLPTLLAVAGNLQPILATLAGTGLRDGEACALNWRDVNLATGTLTVRASKTDAGVRRVDLPLALRELLADHKARAAATAPGDPVFVNREGRRENVSNLGRRLKTVLRRADARLTEMGLEPIGAAVTPYSFRRLYASLRYGLGDDPIYVARQMGHADAGGLSMSVYASALKRRERLTGRTLAEFDKAMAWASMGLVETAPSQGPALTRTVA